jgi:hypothetical protein
MKGLVWGAALMGLVLQTTRAEAVPMTGARLTAREICGPHAKPVDRTGVPETYLRKYPDATVCEISPVAHKTHGGAAVKYRTLIFYLKKNQEEIDQLNMNIFVDKDGTAKFKAVTTNQTNNKFGVDQSGKIHFYVDASDFVALAFVLPPQGAENPSGFAWAQPASKAISATDNYDCDATTSPNFPGPQWPWSPAPNLSNGNLTLNATIPNLAGGTVDDSDICYYYEAYLVGPHNKTSVIDPLIVNHGTPPVFRSRRGAGQPPS